MTKTAEQNAGTIPANREIELKLVGSPESLAAVRAAPMIAGEGQPRGRPKRLENIYYDTVGMDLRQRQIAFRVRKSGRRYVQTVKAGGVGADGLDRAEWETPLGSADPDIDALLHTTALAKIAALSETALRPIFSSSIKRETRILELSEPDGSVSHVELAFDEGTIAAAGDRIPVSEIELELKSGSTAAIFRLALALHEQAPLRVEWRSKSDRGYALADGGPPNWHGSDRLKLKRRQTVDTAMAVILRHCMAHWTANEAAALDGRHPEGVHQMRVGLRRFRSALSIFGGVIPQADAAYFKAEAKWAAGSLGAARDWDVFLSETLATLQSQSIEDAALARLREAAEVAQAAGYETARAAIESPRYTTFLLRLGLWLESGGWRAQTSAWHDRPVADLALHLLAKRQRKVARLGRRFASLDTDGRHRVRIALKKMRYTAGFFSTLYPKKKTKPYLKAMAALQDDLGHLNDIATAQRLMAILRQAGGDRIDYPAGLVVGWHAQRLNFAEPALLQDWDRFADARPFWQSGS